MWWRTIIFLLGDCIRFILKGSLVLCLVNSIELNKIPIFLFSPICLTSFGREGGGVQIIIWITELCAVAGWNLLFQTYHCDTRKPSLPTSPWLTYCFKLSVWFPLSCPVMTFCGLPHTLLPRTPKTLGSVEYSKREILWAEAAAD